MKRLVKGALLAAGTALAISVAPRHARRRGRGDERTETLSGTIVFGRAGDEQPDGHQQRCARQGGVPRRRPGR
jgi:hypothetical protein